MKNYCIFHGAGTEFLNIIYMNFRLQRVKSIDDINCVVSIGTMFRPSFMKIHKLI
jgi:hypothetical protein